MNWINLHLRKVHLGEDSIRMKEKCLHPGTICRLIFEPRMPTENTFMCLLLQKIRLDVHLRSETLEKNVIHANC